MEKDEKLTSVFREKIDAAKKSATKKENTSTVEAIGLVAGILFVAIAKIAIVSLVVWLGANSVCDIIQRQPLTYLQVATILLSAKAIALYIFEQPKKEEN